MHRLPVTVFSLIAPTTAGAGVVIGLVVGLTSGLALGAAAVAGAVCAIPLSWIAVRALDGGPKSGDG